MLIELFSTEHFRNGGNYYEISTGTNFGFCHVYQWATSLLTTIKFTNTVKYSASSSHDMVIPGVTTITFKKNVIQTARLNCCACAVKHAAVVGIYRSITRLDVEKMGNDRLQTKAFPSISVAQVVETVVGDCAIESAVVYQDRAEVKRAVPVRLTPGENEVIVYDLAECVDKNSIRYVRFVPIEH